MTLARFAQGAYTGNDVKGYTIDEAESNSNYTTYVNHHKKHAILAYSGTRLHNISDLHMDYKILTGELHKTKRHKNALNAADRFHSKYTKHGYKTAITGHSLGGRMALEATAHLHKHHKKGTVTEVFNPFTVGGDSFGDGALQSALIRYHPKDPAYTPLDPNNGHQTTTKPGRVRDPKTWVTGPDPKGNPVTTQPSPGAPESLPHVVHGSALHGGTLSATGPVIDHPEYEDEFADQHFKSKVDQAQWMAAHPKAYERHQAIIERYHIEQVGHPLAGDPDWTPIKGAFWDLAPKNVQAALNEFDKQHPWLVAAAETTAAAIPAAFGEGAPEQGPGIAVGEGELEPLLTPQPDVEMTPTSEPVNTVQNEPVQEIPDATDEMNDSPKSSNPVDQYLDDHPDIPILTNDDYAEFGRRIEQELYQRETEPPLRGHVRLTDEPPPRHVPFHERFFSQVRQTPEYVNRYNRFRSDPAGYLLREARTEEGRKSIFEVTRTHFGERRAHQLNKALSIGSKVLVNKAFVHETIHSAAHNYDKYHNKLEKYFNALEAHRLHRYL